MISEMIGLISKYLETRAILLTGSGVDPKQLDFWSDLDLIIILKQGEKIETDKIHSVISKLGKTIAEENHVSQNSMLKRFVISREQDIQRLDLKFWTYEGWLFHQKQMKVDFKILFGDVPAVNSVENQTPRSYSVVRTEKEIHQIWFLFFECVKKFMREDYLIGLHLLFELLQEFLILNMQERDLQHQTNFHRRGDSESLPDELDPQYIDYQDKNAVLAYIGNLAFQFDQYFQKYISGYESRINPFRKYLQMSLEEISRLPPNMEKE